MPINIGAMFASLTLQSDQFTRGTKKASADAKQMSNEIGGAFSKLGGVAAAGLAGLVAGAVAGFGAAAKASFDYAANLKEVAAATGTTVEQYQILERAALGNGVSTEKMNVSLQKLNATLGEAQNGSEAAMKKFKDIGFSPEQVKNLEDVNDAFVEMSEKLVKFDDPAAKAAAAKQLLGKSAGELASMIEEVGTSYDAMTAEALKSGLITAEQADRADEAADSMAMFAQVLKTKLAIALLDNLPAIKSLLDGLIEVINFAGQAINALKTLAGTSLEAQINMAKNTSEGWAVPEEERKKARARYLDLRLQQLYARPGNTSDVLKVVGGRKYKRTPGVQDFDLSSPRSGGGAKPKPSRGGGGGSKRDAAGDMLRDIQFEREQLERTDVEQSVYNNLKRAGVTITSEFGKKIADLTRQLEGRKALKEWNKDMDDFIDKTNEAAATVGMSDADRQRFDLEKLIKQKPAYYGAPANDNDAGDADVVVTGKRRNRADEARSALEKKIAADAADAQKQRMADLQFEREQLVRTDREQYIYNQLKSAGSGISAEYAQEIRNVAGALFDETEAVRKAQEQQQHLQDLANDFGDAFVNAFAGLVNGTMTWQDAMKNAVMDIGNLILEELVYKPMKEMIASGFVKLFTSLLGGRSAALPAASSGITVDLSRASPGAFGRASGGSVSSGRSYWVGEHGPELFHANENGYIQSNARSGARNGGKVINIDARGSTNPAETKRMIAEALVTAMPMINTQAHAYTVGKLTRPRM